MSTSPPVHGWTKAGQSKLEIKVWVDPRQAGALVPGNRYVELKLHDATGSKVALRGAQLIAVRDPETIKSLASKGGRGQKIQEWSISRESIQRVN